MKQYPLRYIPVDAIIPDPENYRKHSDAHVARLCGTIQEVGFIQPIAVHAPNKDGKYKLIAGEGRWEAAILAHLPEVSAVVIDDYDEIKRRIALIGTNGTYGSDDEEALAALLKQLEAEDVDLDLTGIEPYRLEDILEGTEESTLDMELDGEAGEPEPRQVQCPNCGHQFDPKNAK